MNPSHAQDFDGKCSRLVGDHWVVNVCSMKLNERMDRQHTVLVTTQSDLKSESVPEFLFTSWVSKFWMPPEDKHKGPTWLVRLIESFLHCTVYGSQTMWNQHAVIDRVGYGFEWSLSYIILHGKMARSKSMFIYPSAPSAELLRNYNRR